jgi:predicted GNAT family acetyltransferase
MDWDCAIWFWRSLYSYIGYVDGKIATTATVQLCNDKAYLASVLTHPDFRNRGYATTISKYTLQMACGDSGFNISMLHSTANAKAMYEKIGFNVIGTCGIALYSRIEE